MAQGGEEAYWRFLKLNTCVHSDYGYSSNSNPDSCGTEEKSRKCRSLPNGGRRPEFVQNLSRVFPLSASATRVVVACFAKFPSFVDGLNLNLQDSSL